MSILQPYVEAVRVAIAAGGFALLLGHARRPRAPDREPPLAGFHGRFDRTLLVLGLLAGLSWWNFLGFHFSGFVHTWEAYHYYLGGKYFREVGYTRLYACSTVADAEDGLLSQARDRKIRNLETNLIGGTQAVLLDPAACTGRFSAARWQAFKADVAWFRSRVTPPRWALMQMDHGYNGTPVWALLGTPLANTGPASTSRIRTLALLDALLLVVMWACVAWVFGWRVLCVGLIYWGTNHLARFHWTGGGFLRQDWLVLAVVGVCLIKRERMAPAGFLLTWAALIRIFPGLIVLGLLLKTLWDLWDGRGVTPGHRRFAFGAALALVTLLPAATWLAGGPGVWRDFLANTRKHWDTPLANYIGLKTIVAYEHDTRARLTAPLGLEEDPYKVWKDARRRVFAERRWLFAGLVAAFAVALALAVRREPDWVAAVLAVGLIPVLAELTCYYYSILLTYGLL
ncbi:MAG TPA: hypothetical protein VLD61_10440, partial [Methylomirabilota bacterium]|nr:hypothetical protein [Methylomirabilota bacterium]